jgi:hypothetical protein
MSSVSLGAEAKCGKLKCETLEAKNSGGDPHKVVGDLEITGDATVDGKLTAKEGNVRIEHKGGSDQSGLTLRTPSQTWDLYADENAQSISIGYFKDSFPAGVDMFRIRQDAGTGDIGTTINAKPLQLDNNAGANPDAGLVATHSFSIFINTTEYKLLLATP